MTSALGGYGRAENPSRWGASVFLQIINPEAFGGLESFANEMQSFVDRCKSSVLAPGLSEVRLPGERAFKLREMQMKEGVQVHPSIIPSLIQLAEKYQVNFPAYI